MTRPSASYSSEIGRLVERQMRNWELARAQRPSAPKDRRKEVEDFVAISRAVGAGGGAVAQLLGERLGWPVMDKQILEGMAENDDVRRRIYQLMDERDLSWFEEIMRGITLDRHDRNDYFHRLTSTVLTLARKGSAVFVGRAADLILPRTRGLRVRIVAPRQRCIEQYARRLGITPDQAIEKIEHIERDRHEFIRRHFRMDPLEQARHDLILNLDHWTEPQAADLVLSAMKLRGMAL